MSFQQSNRFRAFDGAEMLCIPIDSDNCLSPNPDKFEYDSLITLNKLNKIWDSTPNITIPTINFTKDQKENLRDKDNNTKMPEKIIIKLANNPSVLKALSDYCKELKTEISGMENHHVLVATIARRIANSLYPLSSKYVLGSLNCPELKFNANNIKPFIPRIRANQSSTKVNEMNPVIKNVQITSN